MSVTGWGGGISKEPRVGVDGGAAAPLIVSSFHCSAFVHLHLVRNLVSHVRDQLAPLFRMRRPQLDADVTSMRAAAETPLFSCNNGTIC